MSKTIAQIKAEADQIRLETTTNANTAERVGEAVKDVVEYLEPIPTDIAEDVADLEGRVGDMEGALGDERLIVEGGTLTVDISTGGYISYQGAVASSSSYKRSGFIPVYAGQVIAFKGKASTAVCLVAAYSERDNGTFISSKSLIGAGTGTGTSEDVSYTVPIGVSYIIISRGNAITDTITIDYPSIRDAVGELDRAVNGGQVTIVDWNSGYVNLSGTITASVTYHYSNLIPVYIGQLISFNSQGSNAVLLLSAYDNNGDFIGTSPVNTTGGSGVISVSKTITNGVSYIRVCRHRNYTSPIIIGYDGVQEKIDTINTQLAADETKARRQPTTYRYTHTSPRKACVCFQLDWGTYAASTFRAYKDLLATYGVNESLYAVQPKLFVNSADLSAAKELFDDGQEIALHTDSNHAGIGNESTLDVDGFNELMATYYAEMAAQGLTYTGCVVLSTQLKSTFFPEIVKHHNWQIAGAADASAISDNYASVLMSLSTDYRFPKRLGIELTPEQYADPANEAIVANRAIELIDSAVANCGFLIIYGHSYNKDGATYTIRENSLRPILSHLKTLLDKGVVLTGRTSELIEYFFSPRANEIEH